MKFNYEQCLLCVFCGWVLALAITCAFTAFGHGGGQCLKGTQIQVSHFAPATAGDPSRNQDERFFGGHGHKKYLDGRLQSWGYWTAAGYAQVDESSDEFEDCVYEPVVIPPVPPVAPVAPVVRSPVVQSPVYHYFSLELPAGYSFRHIPFRTQIETVGDLILVLGDAVHAIHVYDRIDQEWVFSEPGFISAGDGLPVLPGYGFVAVMDDAVSVALCGVDDYQLALESGWNLIGLPYGDEFESVADIVGWQDVSAVVTSHDGLLATGKGLPRDEYEFAELDAVPSLDQAYMVLVDEVEGASCAPGVLVAPSLATLWGAIKVR